MFAMGPIDCSKCDCQLIRRPLTDCGARSNPFLFFRLLNHVERCGICHGWIYCGGDKGHPSVIIYIPTTNHRPSHRNRHNLLHLSTPSSTAQPFVFSGYFRLFHFSSLEGWSREATYISIQLTFVNLMDFMSRNTADRLFTQEL